MVVFNYPVPCFQPDRNFQPFGRKIPLYTDHRILPGGSNRYRRSGKKTVHPAGHSDGGRTDTGPGNSRFYSAATIARNPDWRNNFVLWSKTVQSSPNSLVAHGGLGMAYLNRGMLNDAQQEFETAIKLYPNDAKSYYNLGSGLSSKGRFEKGHGEF